MPVRAHQHAETAGGGDLLALHQVGRQVLRDLAGHQLDAADIRLAQAEVPADRQGSVPADQAADIQLAVRPRRKVRLRLVRVAAHVPRAVGHRDDAADGAAAAEAQGQRVLIALQGVAQQRGAQHQAAQRGAGRGAEAVDFPRLLHHIRGGDHRQLDLFLFRNDTQDLSHVSPPVRQLPDLLSCLYFLPIS